MHARPHHAGSPHYRAPRRLTSTVANKNRSMELSELVRMSHSGSLLGMCDSTGIVRPSHLDVPSEGSHAAGPLTEGSSGYGVGPQVYEISPKKGGGAFPRHAIADGNGTLLPRSLCWQSSAFTSASLSRVVALCAQAGTPSHSKRSGPPRKTACSTWVRSARSGSSTGYPSLLLRGVTQPP